MSIKYTKMEVCCKRGNSPLSHSMSAVRMVESGVLTDPDGVKQKFDKDDIVISGTYKYAVSPQYFDENYEIIQRKESFNCLQLPWNGSL